MCRGFFYEIPRPCVAALLNPRQQKCQVQNCESRDREQWTEPSAQTKENKMLRSISLRRIELLAAKYGTHFRFYPGGSEEADEGDVVDKAIKAAEAADEGKVEVDKERQRADQEAANAKKARDQVSETQAELDAANTEKADLQTRLAAAEAKAVEAGISKVDLNPEDYQTDGDRRLVQNIQSLQKQVETQAVESKALKDAAAATKQEATKQAAKDERNAAYQEILSDLDAEYGAEHRNAAIEAFLEKKSAGKVPDGNPAKSALIMQGCYKAAKAAAGKKTDKDDIDLDSGVGGGAPPDLSGHKIPENLSLDEAMKHVSAGQRAPN